MIIYTSYRGETFHSALRVGELRSMLPPTVNVMALTVTATKILRLELSNILGINPD